MSIASMMCCPNHLWCRGRHTLMPGRCARGRPRTISFKWIFEPYESPGRKMGLDVGPPWPSLGLHFLSFYFILFHFLSFSFIFFHFLSFSFFFFLFLSFSFFFFLYLSFSFIFFFFSFFFFFVGGSKSNFFGPQFRHDFVREHSTKRTDGIIHRPCTTHHNTPTSTARAGALMFHHPAWVEHHTGGSRSTPTVHPC